ncbi:MAG: choice-of-anchor D domain-containing protein [Pseudomonadota bacterium]
MTPTAAMVLCSLGLLLQGCQEYSIEEQEPLLSVFPEQLAFDGVRLGEQAELSVVVSNAGAGPGRLDGTRVSRPFRADDLSGIIEAGTTRELVVGFDASDPEDAAGTLVILSDDAAGGSLIVTLAGSVAVQAISVEPTSLAFEVGADPVELELTLTNVGEGVLEIVETSIEDDAVGAFTLPSPLDGATLPAGAGASLPVVFDEAQPRTAVLRIASDDPANPEVVVPLSTVAAWATITSPADEGVLPQEEDHYLYGAMGSVGDPGEVEVSWRSSVDGDLGSGSISPTGELVNMANLSGGWHELSLTVTTWWGAEAQDQVSVCVNTGPSAEITWPPPGTWKYQGYPFHFEGLGSDPWDPPETLAMQWASDVDGELLSGMLSAEGLTGTGPKELSPGLHTVTLTVTDPWGSEGSDRVEVFVVDCSDADDHDGDGYSALDGDCDDMDPAVHPGQTMDLGDPSGACWGGAVVTIEGASHGDSFGFSFGDPGDIDGDGLPDMIIGANDAVDGEAYLLLGRDREWRPLLHAADLPRIAPDQPASSFGHNVTVAQDIDGDGMDEVMVSSNHSDGEVWIFYGRGAWLDLPSSAADFDVFGPGGAQNFGEDVSSADFDGDGHGDIVLGAGEYGSEEGRVWILSGSTSYPASFSAEGADLTISGPHEGGSFGNALSQVGDVDGDGLPDLVISSEEADYGATNTGAVFLYTGLTALSGHLQEDDWTAFWPGENQGDELGTHDLLARAGDLDQDGLSDMLFIASGFDNGPTTDAGKVYLVPGSADLEGLQRPGREGWSWVGDGGGDLYGANGEGLAPAGDVDGDGLPDFLVGADDDDSVASNAGRVYLFLGASQGGWGRELPLISADRMFYGLDAGHYAGRAVYGVGDMDANGVDDFAVGAYGAGPGTVYLYLNDYGHCPE